MLQPNLTPEEAIKQIYKKPDWKSHVNERLCYREYQQPKDSEESLEQLVKWYTNKRSKRVAYAGKKLKKLFLDLPKKEQRMVGLALLNGCKVDCEWVCKRLLDYKELYKDEWDIRWHPCYSEAVEAYWNKWHSESCGKLVIQFLSEETVRKYLNELQNDCYYFELCRRFVDKPWFQLDIEKLKMCTHINAYLSVMVKTASGISKEEARKLLYQWVAVILVHDGKHHWKPTKDNIFWNEERNKHRVINIWGIDTALYYLLCMGLDNVVNDFLEWDEMVYSKYKSELIEFAGIEHIGNEDEFRRVVFECIPDDMRYLMRIDNLHFRYLESVGRPFTIPRSWDFYTDEEHGQQHNMYPESAKIEMHKENPRRMSEDDLNKVVEKNPALGKLLGVFDLQDSESTKNVPF